MTDLAQNLAAAGVPSQDAIAVMLDGMGQGASRADAVRQAVVVDAPAILRELLAERLAEMPEHDLTDLEYRMRDSRWADAWGSRRSALLALLCPEVSDATP